MKKTFILKRTLIALMSISLLFSNVSLPVQAATAGTAAAVVSFLKAMGFTFVASGVGTLASTLVSDWLTGGKNYYDSSHGGGGSSRDDMDYYSNNSGNMGTFINSGAGNENCYNTYSSTTTNNRTFSLVKDSYNTTTNTYNTLVYNPITNNYTTVNNISYNNQYDTYYITNNEYNYYITNNYTYVSYYIIDNSTQNESYYEIYYEMPDGKNSYDLAPDEVWGQYFVYEVTQYESVLEDDGKTLALYHLDGDGKDSSANKNIDMTLGSGIFQEGKFGQGLYISSTARMYLPESFDENNFTLEFTVINNLSSDVLWVPSVGIGYDCWSSSLKSIIVPGVLSFALQCSGGEYSLYCNGQKVSSLSSEYEYTYKDGYFVWVYPDGGYIDFMPFESDISGTYAKDGAYILDEVRLSNCALYSGDAISVSNQAFDTNQVLILPPEAHENLIAVQGKYAISDYRIGGVRPTYPTTGYVWICLEDDKVVDIQQYEGDAWCSINGAIYINDKWHDLKNYDFSSLTIEEPEDSGGGDSGGSGSGSSGSGGSVSGNGGSDGSGITSIIEGLGKFLDTLLSLIGKVVGLVSDFISSVLGMFSSLTAFTEGFSGFLAEAFGFLPEEAIAVLCSGITVIVILAIIRFLKG